MLVNFLRKNMFILVVSGFCLGIISGILIPDVVVHLSFISDIFISSIKLMITPLIFTSIFLGVLDNDSKNIGSMFVKSILVFVCLFLCTTFISLPIAYFLSPGSGFDLSVLVDQDTSSFTDPDLSITSFVSNIIPTTPTEPFITGNVLQMIFITLIFAAATSPFKKEAKPLIDIVKVLSKITYKIIDIIMLISPFAVFTLIANTTATYGLSVLEMLGQYVLTSYLLFFVVMILIVIIPLKLLTNFKFSYIIKSLSKVWILALSTSSSAATLPTTFNVVEKDFKVETKTSRFVLPLSTTFNMIGGAVSFSVLSIFCINIFNIDFTYSLLLQIILFSTVLNMSAPGIPGGGIILGMTFLTMLNIPIEIMAMIAGIYRVVDMIFTTLNVSGDVIGAVIISKVFNKEKIVNKEVLVEVNNG